MNFIKKVIDGDSDVFAHIQFQKFSKGEFRDRAIIHAKRSGNKFTINTSAEFANELVVFVAKKLGDKKTRVTGAIVSTLDLDIPYKEKKQFQGVKRFLIDSEMAGNEILKLVEENPKVFFGLTFESSEGTKLKIKPKAPKSGKPGKGDEEPKADFCKLVTEEGEIAKNFVFEKPEFKKAEIKHTFFVDEIVPPAGETDYAKIRELAKRRGRIIRESVIDEIRIKKEYGFEA